MWTSNKKKLHIQHECTFCFPSIHKPSWIQVHCDRSVQPIREWNTYLVKSTHYCFTLHTSLSHWIQNKNFILIYPLKEDYLIITHNFKHILWTGQTFLYLPQLDEQQKLNSYYKNHTHYLIHLPSLVRCWQFILGQMFKGDKLLKQHIIYQTLCTAILNTYQPYWITV
jgi:hypothetical protein